MFSRKLAPSLVRSLSTQTKPIVPKQVPQVPKNLWKRREHTSEESYFQNIQRKILDKIKQLTPEKPKP